MDLYHHLDNDDDIDHRLHVLHEQFVELVNAAVEAGRDDLVASLSDSYLDEGLRLILDTGRPATA